MENKQTAVDFLDEMIHFHCLINDTEDVMIDYNTLDKLFMKAKQMEKEQIIDAYDNGGDHYTETGKAIWGKDYYNETYGK